MKSIRFLIILFALGFLPGCKLQKKTDDPEILKKILTDYFEGIRSRDLNKMNSVTTNDFILFEDGKVWTNDSLVIFFKQV